MISTRRVAGHLWAQHIRPFMPTRDLEALAYLIERAFGEELAVTRSNMARQLRQMAAWGPLLYFVQPTVSLLTGYVWEENGRLVGNATITREHRSGVWMLSNVAVLPEYRGRGIASRLVDMAIAHARYFGAEKIVLQVRRENLVAKNLYIRRGFVICGTVHELEAHPWDLPVLVGVRRIPQLRHPTARDAAQLQALAELCREHCIFQVHSRDPGGFKRGMGWKLRSIARFLTQGERWVEWVVDDRRSIVAHGRLCLRAMRETHELMIRVDPKVRGKWEAILAEQLLAASPHWRKPVRALVADTHPELLSVLADKGFRTLRVLDQMVLKCGAAPLPAERMCV